MNTISVQLDFKSLEDEKTNPAAPGKVLKEDKPEYYKTAADVRTAWINGDVNALSSLSGGKYLFEKKGENTYLIINASNTKDVKGPFYKLDDVGSFFGVSARDTWTKKMGKARAAAAKTPAQSNVLSGSRADWKKAGWSDAQINEGVKNGSIKVI